MANAIYMSLSRPLRALVRSREEFLRKEKINVVEFGVAVGLGYDTVIKYFEYGRAPRPLYLDRILKKFPNWPH